MGNSTKELVNAFNLNNYFSDKVNANFTVEGKKVVGLFASGTNIREYLQGIGEEIIKRHYLSGTEVAGAFYNLNCFPFVLGANANKEDLGNGIVKVKLTGSMDPAVIHNLKIHFANEFERAVTSRVIARLQRLGTTKKEAYEWIRGIIQTGAIGSPYLYCIAFSGGYLSDPEIFEMFKEMYIQEFNSRLKACGLKSSDFYEYKDDMLYIRDVSDKVVKSVAEYVKKEVALDFRIPGKEDSKVENFKDVLSSLMSKRVRKFINTYDIFTDEKKIQNGDSFVLIPLIEMDDGQFETLSPNDARNIDQMFNKGILNGFHCISDIRGKTANPQFANCKEPVYAFSNKQIALLLPMIMRSPIAYNQINGHFEFAVDPGNFRSRHGLLSPEPPRTPPNQRKKDTDSGYDSNSPPKPKDSGAQSSSGGPRSLCEQPQTQKFLTRSPNGALEGPTRQWSREEETGGLLRAMPEEIGLTSISNCQQLLSSLNVLTDFSSEQGACGGSQPMGLLSPPASSARLWPQMSSFVSEPSSSKGSNKSMLTEANIRDQKMTRRSSSIPFPIAWDNSISLNHGVSEGSPKDTENICNEEPEKQQVTDKSDRKSSDECSEAKSQDSKSPKEHGGGVQKIKKLFSSPFKKQYDVSLKRHDVGRDTTRSTPETPVTEKPPVSKPFFSFPTRIKAKSNPPSGVTSPTHEGGPEWQQRLDPDQRDELRPLLSPEKQRRLDSNSFLPGKEQHLYLTHTLSGKRELSRFQYDSEQSQLLRLTKAQLPDNSSSKRDSGYSSGLPASPAPPHKESVSSEVKECRTVEHTRETWGKRI